MTRYPNNGLTLLGKVSKTLIRKMFPEYQYTVNSGWFFADYTYNEVKTGSHFDIILLGTEHVLSPGKVSIKVKQIADQFGNLYKTLPDGYQVMVELECKDKLPSLLNRLPTATDWEYTIHPVTIAFHEDIRLKKDEGTEWMYRILVEHLKEHFSNRNTIPLAELTAYLEQKMHTRENARILKNTLKILGMIRERNNRQPLVEFADM